jgi:hypothetical protein
MTDKEILNEVYGQLTVRGEMPSTQDAGSVRRFIEQEWQKRDEEELIDQYNRNRKPEDWAKDVKDISPPPSWVKDEWYHSYPPVDIEDSKDAR